ncbi:hypothetical protein B0H19DRAFT_278257 [Mycena capillaripes]|nr:hypothetical protein B0H19DRAFT_278257 [Mycena capillaripes]
MAQNVTYDDRDPILAYSPGWFHGTFNASSIGQTGTLTSSSITTGVNVTFVFPTPATEFFYFGIKRCCGGSYLICVDCDPNNRRFETIDAVDPTDNGENPPVVLYSKKFPEAGVHEIILMNQPDPAFGGNSQITLDKFQLMVPDSAAVETVYASTPSFATQTPLASAALAQANSSSSTTKLVPILAGVLGGLTFLLVLLGIWLLLRRKIRRPVYSEEQASATSPQTESLWRTNPRFTSFTGSTTTATISTFVSSRREQDAGRIDNYLSSEDTLPPEYGEVFRPAAHPLPPPSPFRALDKPRG